MSSKVIRLQLETIDILKKYDKDPNKAIKLLETKHVTDCNRPINEENTVTNCNNINKPVTDPQIKALFALVEKLIKDIEALDNKVSDIHTTVFH